MLNNVSLIILLYHNNTVLSHLLNILYQELLLYSSHRLFSSNIGLKGSNRLGDLVSQLKNQKVLFSLFLNPDLPVY